MLATPNLDYIENKENMTLMVGLSALQDDKRCQNVTLLKNNALKNDEKFKIFLLPSWIQKGSDNISISLH